MFVSKHLSKGLRNVMFAICSLLLSVGSIMAQDISVTGKVTDKSGEPIVGAYVLIQGTTTGASTDIDGNYSVTVASNGTLVYTSMGYKDQTIAVSGRAVINVTMEDDALLLDDVVVTALGIKKEKKALGYAVQDIKADELIKNKSANVINSLSGKIAGVNVTQSGGAAGAGSSIILRGGTSLERDNQPLFVVDGIIYDNSSSINGNSGFDGATRTSTTTSNRVMDINPEDIENMSVLKGPAAAALYGSKAAAGVIVITTKRGKEGTVQVNLSSKTSMNWINRYPLQQDSYKRGYYDTQGKLDDYTTQSWGAKFTDGEKMYNNIENFFQNSWVYDNNVSVSGGNERGNFFLSGSRFDQKGIIPGTGYDKTTFRFNGEQKYGILRVGANVAYSLANTDKTLTSAGLWGSGGTGAMNSVYKWARNDDMKHYLNEDGSKYRMFEGRQELEDDVENPYWTINKNQFTDQTERITGSINANIDIFDWWSIAYRVGIDSYLTSDQKIIAAEGAVKQEWQNGMMSQGDTKYNYLSSNFMMNFHKTFGDFDLNLLLGQMTEDSKTVTDRKMGWDFIEEGFYSFNNILDANKRIAKDTYQNRLIGVYGEFRAAYKNIAYISVTGRNDWTSTLPKENNSYFYPSVSGSFVFSELLPKNDVLSFAKLRASWATVGKDASPYATNTYLWPSREFLYGIVGAGNNWGRGNPYLKPEQTTSWEIGLDMKFFGGRLGFDYTFYSNNSYNQILSPRLSQTTGYIFCSVNAGDITNKGMELSINATPVQTRDFTWDMTLNASGNRGRVGNLMKGVEILYVTDVQVGNAKAASFNDGNFMAISGSEYSTPASYYDKNKNEIQHPMSGKTILDPKTGMPTYDGLTTHEIGNREPTIAGGWNNSLQYKSWNLSFLFEYRIGGDVYNGTDYWMTYNGMSEFSMNRESITIDGVVPTGETKEGFDKDGKAIKVPQYKDASFTYKAGQMYDINGTMTSGNKIIQDYYQTYYNYNSENFMTKTNWLRLRNVSLTYALPESILRTQKVVKGFSVTLTGTNLFLWTNYKGMDPETSAAGSGVTGSSSVGIDYCGVPSTAGVSLGLNLTF